VSSSSALKLAATVVLLRDAPGGLEAYLVRRGSRAAFMPDLHVYPGGRVDESDDALVETLRWDGSAVPPNGHGPASLVAAIRELFEEAGVMLTVKLLLIARRDTLATVPSPSRLLMNPS
jgi:8-oxo-dGTP pyrophosphatase MutT (NUDIX family)